MKLIWASEISQQLNACRLFTDKDFAEARIIKEMIEKGYILFYKARSGEEDSFLLRFIKEPKKSEAEYLTWVFCWIEVEEE